MQQRRLTFRGFEKPARAFQKKSSIGQTVLIHGGSGGVGHYAIQFAKAKGARVLTTVSTGNVQFARELGADVVIDYKRQRFDYEASDLDMVFDLIDGETRERSWKLLKKAVSWLRP